MIGSIYDCTSDDTLTVCTHGGLKDFTQMSPFKVLPMEVNFNLDSMANILAIKDVSSTTGVHISMDPRKERAIIVEYQKQIIKFQECRDGLYYYDTFNKSISPINYYYFLSTAKDNKEYFSNSEIQGSEDARKV